MNRHLTSGTTGFSLLELILVIAIIGILGAVVLPKHMQNSLVTQSQARQVLNDIRYAQAMSMSTGQRYRWVKASATSYQITNAAGTPLLLPNGNNTFTLANGNAFGGFSNLPNELIAFDAFGVPYSTTTLPGTSLTTIATITIVNGSTNSTISINPTTGLGQIT